MSFFQQQQPQASAFGGFGGAPQQQQQPQMGAFGQQPQQPVSAFGAQPNAMGAGMNQQQAGNWQQSVDNFDVPIQANLSDAVSQLKFSPAPAAGTCYQMIGYRMLAAATWDGTVLIFQVNHQDNGQTPTPANLQQQFEQKINVPILGMCWQADQVALLLACADNTIKKFDLNTNQVQVVGQHAMPVKDVCSFIHPQNNASLVISGGWDARVKFWSWNNGQLQQIGEAYLAMPVHYMSCQFPLLVTAHQDRFIHVWYLPENFASNNWNPKDVTESPLKFSTTSIQVFGDGKGYAVGSIEGRCGIKNYDPQKQELGKSEDFCFKCHREETKGASKADVYSVNGITFNTLYNTFATYGSDGMIVIWNKDTKSKYRSSKKFPAPFTAASFTDDGKLLAYAIGYDWSKGFEEQRNRKFATQIFVRSPDVKEEVFKRRK